MKLKLMLIFGCFCNLMLAQDYNVLLIPDSLKKGADVVKRDEEYILTIKSPSKYTLYARHAYTMLNAGGNHYARYRADYGKFNTINYVTGKMFNAFGKETRRTKKADWEDRSAYDGFSLMSDDRYKVNEFYSGEYPYTVEFEEEDDFNGFISFEDWAPQGANELAVEHSKYTIIAPLDYSIRYKQFNIAGTPVITQKGNERIYTWEIRNLPALHFENAAPNLTQIAPVVLMAPSQFEAQGYKGDMTTWEGYGKFIYQLLKGRDVLPDDIKAKVHELTDHLKTDREKVFVLYDYLQKNTRYISVQLGIGGWQPFEAAYVAKNKYGDCKALSNFMISLLKEAGIMGKYVEIRAGESAESMVDDFPCFQFNHVITCVPLAKDTIWLECTSSDVSPGYMGSFTGNRKAMLIDETGGHVVQTPVYKLTDNTRKNIIKAVTDSDGNLIADIAITYSGLEQDEPHGLMHEASKEEQETYLNQIFNLPTYKLIRNEYREHKDVIPTMEQFLQIELNLYATITGKRLFLNPNLLGMTTKKLLSDTARKYDYMIKESYRHIDSVQIKIPKGYKLESIPKDNFIQGKLGKYISNFKVNDEKIIYYRLMEQNSGRIAAKDYVDLVKYYDQVYKADRSKLVFVKNE